MKTDITKTLESITPKIGLTDAQIAVISTVMESWCKSYAIEKLEKLKEGNSASVTFVDSNVFAELYVGLNDIIDQLIKEIEDETE
jgi:hypothetical protein